VSNTDDERTRAIIDRYPEARPILDRLPHDQRLPVLLGMLMHDAGTALNILGESGELSVQQIREMIGHLEAAALGRPDAALADQLAVFSSQFGLPPGSSA